MTNEEIIKLIDEYLNKYHLKRTVFNVMMAFSELNDIGKIESEVSND